LFLWVCFACTFPLSAAPRPFDTVFPGLDPAVKKQAFSVPPPDTAQPDDPPADEERGYSHCVTDPAGLTITGTPADTLFSGPFAGAIEAGAFSYISENLLVVPYTGNRPITLLDIYNALQQVRNMAGIKYHSFTRKKWVPLFEEATRVDDPGRRTPIPDPAHIPAIPDTETIYVRLKDINLGATIYRSELAATGNALLYTITNHKTSTLFFVPVIKREHFVSRIYLEPLEEGILVYCAAAIKLPAYIERMISVPSALKKRLDVLIEWALAGLPRPPPLPNP
jgi:hypothetical protein